MDYENKIFPHTGGYGRYNRIVVVFSWFPNFAAMLNLFSDVFYTLIPDSYHCRPDPKLLPSTFLLSNFSTQGYLNLTIPWVNGSGFSHCQLYKYPSNTSDFSENVPREKVSCTQGWEYPPVAGLQSNFVTEWNLVCGDYWKVPVQHISFMTGWILGYIFLGTLCDWLGRRRAFLLSISLSSLFGVAVCLSSSPVVFLLLRLSQGATLAGVLVSSYIARLELCDPPHRLMVAMISGFFGVLAELLLPGVAVLCRDWPVLQAVATLPLLLLLSYWCCASVFPESPRWLLATAQIPQVKKSLQEFSTRNGICLQDEIYSGENLLPEIDSVYGEDCQPIYHSVLELRRTRVIWKNCLILSFTLFIGTGIQYCFTRNLHSYSTNFYFSYFLRVTTGAVGCIFICLSVNHFGRRGILLLSAIITGLSSLLLLALTQYLRGSLVLLLSVVGLLFSQGLAMLSAFFASEVMPTVIRVGPLITLTELLSQEENLSLSATVPMLFNLKKRHLSPEEDDSPAIAEMKETLIAEIDSRWQLTDLDPSSLYLLSSALDHRFKQLRFLNNEKKDLVYIVVVRLAEHLHQRHSVREGEMVPTDTRA
ncbi:putative solute carrier family 22 member 31 isoform X1 [Stegastes partitus]|uniref:Solute carrier family 22 member 31 isoform X1 n=1 Tax=Stegastes partitus TaxID=144197 RepID=A0A9Y4N2E0_9TELE|nr:PREDICTED: putative solute carrier family 22 member 31 isoform X1 [Stegastes partitus]